MDFKAIRLDSAESRPNGNMLPNSDGGDVACFHGRRAKHANPCKQTEVAVTEVVSDGEGFYDLEKIEQDRKDGEKFLKIMECNLNAIENKLKVGDRYKQERDRCKQEGDRYRQQSFVLHDENKKLQSALEKKEGKVKELEINYRLINNKLLELLNKKQAAEKERKEEKEQLSAKIQSLSARLEEVSRENHELRQSLDGQSYSGFYPRDNQANSMMFQSESASLLINPVISRVLSAKAHDPIKVDRPDVVQWESSEIDTVRQENQLLKKELCDVKEQLLLKTGELELAQQKIKDLEEILAVIENYNQEIVNELDEKTRDNIQMKGEREAANKQVQALTEQISFYQQELSSNEHLSQRLTGKEQELSYARQELIRAKQEIESLQVSAHQSAQVAEEAKQVLEQLKEAVSSIRNVIHESTDDRFKQTFLTLFEPFFSKSVE